MPSRSLEHATGEEIVHLCTKNLQKGVGKYHFQRFIGRGTIFLKLSPNHVRFYLSQYRVYEGTNESKRKNDKNVKNITNFLHCAKSFDFSN